MKLVDVRPVYAAELSAANMGGTVTLDALIGTDGEVQDLTVVSAPDAALATAAMDAVKTVAIPANAAELRARGSTGERDGVVHAEAVAR